MDISHQQLRKYHEKKYSDVQTSKLKKSSTLQIDEEDTFLFNQIIRIIDNMYDMRFIQKIARPVEKRVKEEYVQKFAGKMESLHTKIQKIRTEIVDRTKNQAKNNMKNKSNVGSVTNKPINWRKSIRQIQTRYTQFFIDGSFKHYPKIMSVNGFIYPLKTIRIQQWATFCLNYNKAQSKCCDCLV